MYVGAFCSACAPATPITFISSFRFHMRTPILILTLLVLCGGSLIAFKGLGINSPPGSELSKEQVDSNQKITVTYLELLGGTGIVGVLMLLLQNENRKLPVIGDVQDKNEATEELKTRYRNLHKRAKEVVEIANDHRHGKFKEMAYRFLIKAAVLFSLCQVFSAATQTFLSSKYPLTGFKDKTSVEYYAAFLLQTELMFAAAVLVPFVCFWFYMRNAEFSSVAVTITMAVRIGGLGLFMAGAIFFMMLSPEQLGEMLKDESEITFRSIGVSSLLYTAVLKLVLFPIVGFLSCLLCLKLFSPKKEKRLARQR